MAQLPEDPNRLREGPYERHWSLLTGVAVVWVIIVAIGARGWFLDWMVMAWGAAFAALLVLWCRAHRNVEAVGAFVLFLSTSLLLLFLFRPFGWIGWIVYGAFAGAMALVIFEKVRSPREGDE